MNTEPLKIIIVIFITAILVLSMLIYVEINTEKTPEDETNDDNGTNGNGQNQIKYVFDNTTIPIYPFSTDIVVDNDHQIWDDMNVSDLLNKSTYGSNISVLNIYEFYDTWLEGNDEGWIQKRQGYRADPITINITSGFLKFQKEDEGVFISILQNQTITPVYTTFIAFTMGNWTLINVTQLPD